MNALLYLTIVGGGGVGGWGGSEKGQICILSFVDDPWLMNLNTHTNTHTPMLERTSNAEVSAFQGAEVPTNRYEYPIPF